MAHTEQDYLSSEQVSELTGLSRSYFEKLRVRGEGPPYCKISPRRVLYGRKDLIDWIERHRVHSTSEQPNESRNSETECEEGAQ